MSRRHEIERHRRRLGEVRSIMDSMKILAYMETRKLHGFIDAQRGLVSNIEDMAVDFLHAYPEMLPSIQAPVNIFLIVGSQRGFCADFNEVFTEHLQLCLDNQPSENTLLIAVGQKLHSYLVNAPFETFFVDGANVAEEISNTVEQIASTLAANKQSVFSLYALHHTAEDNSIVSEMLLPPFFQCDRRKRRFAHPPLLNLPPEVFFLQLTEQYLFTTLHRILYASLMAENQQRIQHLEHAVNHLDEKTNELLVKGNALRQEEIIEEIEVILLNASVAWD